MKRCGICSRLLNSEQDPLSGDTGGDCWGCMGKIEADFGEETTASFIKDEIEEGWRDEDGTAKPQAFFETDAEWQRKVAAGYKPWFGRPFSHCRVCGFDHSPIGLGARMAGSLAMTSAFAAEFSSASRMKRWEDAILCASTGWRCNNVHSGRCQPWSLHPIGRLPVSYDGFRLTSARQMTSG